MTQENSLQHVLYVDDEPDMRMLVQLTLENMGGIRVTLCESGVDILELALDTKPQMIILDAMMPGMDGPSILQEIKQDARIAHIPVIFLTSRAEAKDILHFKSMGAAGVIAKPFDLVALPEQVRSLWEKCHVRA